MATALTLSKPGDKLAILEAIAQTWNHAGINYAVAHGVEGYPLRTGRDLDVLVQRDQIVLALSLAAAVFREGHWRVAYPRAIWGKRLIAVPRSGERGMLEIHTVSALTWRNVTLATHPAPTNWIGPFKVDPWVSIAKRVVGPLLAGQLQRFLRRPGEFSATNDELRAASDRLPLLVGASLAQTLVTAMSTSDLECIRPLIARLRRSAVMRSLFLQPMRSLELGLNSVRRKSVQLLSPCAPVIALVGPDGVGKSTTLEALRQSTSHIFLDIIVRHWRPGVLPRLAELAQREMPRPNAQGFLPPRRHPGRFRWFRLLYYYLDFLIGGRTKDRLASSRQCLVLYDRCFLDMAVDPLRFGLSSSRGTSVCWRWLPKPDRIILLSDEPKRIHARKPELTEPEIQRQLDEWQRLARAGHVHSVIAVHASGDQLIDRIWDVITDAFMEKNGGDPEWHAEARNTNSASGGSPGAVPHV